MRSILSLTCLAILSVVCVESGWIGWFDKDKLTQADQPQNDQPATNTALQIIEELGRSFEEVARRRSSWLDRYSLLANQTATNSQTVQELLQISRIAMPLIWGVYASEIVEQAGSLMANGGLQFYEPHTQTIPHPLTSLSTELTEDMDFTINVYLVLTEEANVGLRLMYEPAEGDEFDWDNDDIYYGLHLRWHFDHGPDREVAMVSKHDGEWVNTIIEGGDNWPNIKVGEKFVLSIRKSGGCVDMFILHGPQIALQDPYFPKNYHYCPEQQNNGGKLRVIVNEDNQQSGQLQVYGIMWFPGNVFSMS